MSSRHSSKQKVTAAPFVLQGTEELQKQINYQKLQVAELAIFSGKTNLVNEA